VEGCWTGRASGWVYPSCGYSSWRFVSVLLFLSSNLLSTCALDLHPGNIVLVDERISKMSAEDVLRLIGSPETAEVHGKACGSHTPQYLVLPSTLPLSRGLSNNCKVKVIDFGSAFLSGQPSPKMRCPLPVRAPEAVIAGIWDVEADV
jgi:hypothetical protein